jgi:hypothetical protein
VARTAIRFLVQGIKFQTLVVWYDAACQWYELSANGVVEGILPVYPRQDVWSESDGHRGQFSGSYCIIDEVLPASNVLQQAVC